MKEPEAELTDHMYDGIQEYDNPLPGWWKMLFFLSVVFSVFYFLYYHTGTPGRTVYDEYNQQVSEMMDRKFSELGQLEPTNETILKYAGDKKWVKVGEVVFKSNCSGCHGTEGQGITGPNLTDDFWKHVKEPADIAKVISDGANNGAMPAWKNRLGHINKIVLAASYIASLRGKNVSGKPPEGSRIPAWTIPKPEPVSSTGPGK